MTKGKKVIDFTQAEMNARKVDLKVKEEKFKNQHNGIDEETFNNAMMTLSLATGQELYVGTKRSTQSKVRFAQMIQGNLGYLYEKKYLSDREKIFLMDIMPYIAFSSNCIVHSIKTKSSMPANISEIAKLIGTERSHTSRIVNSLLKKGIVAKAESGIEGNNAKAYAVFLNPNIIYAGDKDNVNETLKAMFKKAMNMPTMKDLPIKLF